MVKAKESNNLTDEGKRAASRAKIKIKPVKSITKRRLENEEEFGAGSGKRQVFRVNIRSEEDCFATLTLRAAYVPVPVS